ncbi:MAG TPA: hypothetical protein VN633_18160 [Bryobacteraceae bacterium]|nr:hypothetical protein [Bryobacteraceae bacterium]
MTPETRLTDAEIAELLDPGKDATFPISKTFRRALRELQERREAERKEAEERAKYLRGFSDEDIAELEAERRSAEKKEWRLVSLIGRGKRGWW